MNTIAFSTLIIAVLNAIFFPDIEAMTIEQVEKMMKPLGKTCATKSGISPEIQEAHKRREFPDDPGLKCYFGCLIKMTKVVDKNNKVDMVGTIKQMELILPEEIAKTGVNAFRECCAEAPELNDLCDIGYYFATCHYGKDPKSYFYP